MRQRLASAIVALASFLGAVTAAHASTVYSFQVPNGPLVRMTVAIPSTSQRVRAIEVCRKALRQPRLTYVLVTLDNRNGRKEFRLGGAKIVTRSGATIRLTDVVGHIGNWPTPEDRAGGVSAQLANKCTVDLYNAWLNKADVLPGARSVAIIATKSSVVSVRNIWATQGNPGDGIPRIRYIE